MWTAEKIYYQNSSGFTRAYQGSELVWDKNANVPLYFTAKANNSEIQLSTSYYQTAQTLEYSFNGNSWTNMTTATTIYLSSGETVYLRGILSSNNTTTKYTNFSMSGDIKVGGNINYLWDYRDIYAPLKEYCGYNLFSQNSALTDASELFLPSLTLNAGCYEKMFYVCQYLTKGPEILPATTLYYDCYNDMFCGCVRMISGPTILPADEVESSSYYGMFMSCNNLTTAPIISATKIAPYACQYMFDGCKSLMTAPELPATQLGSWCYDLMFNECTSLITAPSILPATTLPTGCYSRMFSGCASLTTAPELPATALAAKCYSGMFSGCTALNYIKCLATDISANECTKNWVTNVSANGTFIKNANMSGWTSGNDGIPNNWTIQNV